MRSNGTSAIRQGNFEDQKVCIRAADKETPVDDDETICFRFFELFYQ